MDLGALNKQDSEQRAASSVGILRDEFQPKLATYIQPEPAFYDRSLWP